MTRDTSRSLVRVFIAVGFGWICCVPGLTAPNAIFMTAASISLAAACALFLRHFNRFALLLYAASLLVILWTTRGLWLFPPVIFGFLLATVLFVLLKLSRHPAVPQTATRRPPSTKQPNGARFFLFFCIWLSGLLTLGLFPSTHSGILLMAWSCLMLILGQNQWNQYISAEWHGYKTRRSIFVPRKTWIFRFVCLGILGIFCTLLAILCLGQRF